MSITIFRCPSRARTGEYCNALVTGEPIDGWSKCGGCHRAFIKYMASDYNNGDAILRKEYLLATLEGENHKSKMLEIMTASDSRPKRKRGEEVMPDDAKDRSGL